MGSVIWVCLTKAHLDNATTKSNLPPAETNVVYPIYHHSAGFHLATWCQVDYTGSFPSWSGQRFILINTARI